MTLYIAFCVRETSLSEIQFLSRFVIPFNAWDSAVLSTLDQLTPMKFDNDFISHLIFRKLCRDVKVLL
jgi:hypothetical protein